MLKRKYVNDHIQNKKQKTIDIYFDIKIILNNKKEFKLEKYSSKLIKSGYEFNNEDLFEVNKQRIEGLFKSDVLYVYYKNCKREGKFCYESLIHKLVGEYKNNKKDGIWTLYSKWINNNEVLKVKGILKNGKLNGLFEEFHDDGNRYIKCYFENNKLVNTFEVILIYLN